MLASALSDVEGLLSSMFLTNVELLDNLIIELFRNGGKRIRPSVHLAASGLCNSQGKSCGAPSEESVKVAAILECIHTASLLHDDVVDNAVTRRGCPSANAIYGNKVAVLSGDYLINCAFLEALNLPDSEHLSVLIEATRRMSVSEIVQIEKTGEIALTMTEYENILYGKTVSLFYAACVCATISTKLPANKRNALKNYGENFGYAFQMTDDLLDYFGKKDNTGKELGTDLDEQKATLPLLLLMKVANITDKARATQLFKSDAPRSEKLAQILPLLEKYDIEKKAADVVHERIKEAIDSLHDFPDSEYKDYLVGIAHELNQRTK
ncbi:polyprenyl synthetase family protein [Deferribacterales bacterium RsTz2092]|nr:octaprenyl-diphosphate synthase [Deferribacterales bacterium]